MTLRLPVTSTTLGISRPLSSTKLTAAAVQELVSIAEDCEALHALCAQPDLDVSFPRTATSDQRGALVDPTGGTQ
ncbi:MAG TPA: hypothetical protein VFB12_13025 [Ktedonobacteraceae bacterium]|nr:hypothetical protein [Ktedonobacteraceae bacterium]